MGKQEKSGDQTEKPTPKRLKDARKQGDIPKSKELSSTAVVLAWLGLAWLSVPLIRRELATLFDDTLEKALHVDGGAMPALWLSAFKTLMLVSLPLLLAGGAIGLMTEFLQVGALYAPKRVVPDLSRLNPGDGLKRIFSQESFIEVLKSLFKTAALVLIFVLVLLRMLPQVLRLPLGSPADMEIAHWQAVQWIGIWTVCVFFFLSALDVGYQRFAFAKKLRMSRREIKQEVRDNEGDPYIKGRRRQLHQEWAQQNMLAAVRKSSAVVVNPEHIAVAILYDPQTTTLPIVSAKGEDYEAQLIREAAAEAGVPIMRNVELARSLHASIGVDEHISAEFFQAIAELLRWAESVRHQR
jgi:type III secretion protein U